jgi:hypothetical protein
MEFGMMPIGGQMVIDRLLDLFLNAVWIRKRFAMPSTTVILRQPDVGYSFFGTEFRGIMQLRAFHQLVSVVRIRCQKHQAP